LLAIAAQEQLPHKHRIDWQTRPPAAPHPGSHIAIDRAKRPSPGIKGQLNYFSIQKKQKKKKKTVSVPLFQLVLQGCSFGEEEKTCVTWWSLRICQPGEHTGNMAA